MLVQDAAFAAGGDLPEGDFLPRDGSLPMVGDLAISKANPTLFLTDNDGDIIRVTGGGNNPGMAVSFNSGASYQPVIGVTTAVSGQGEVQLYGPDGQIKMNLELSDVAFFQSIRMEPNTDVNLGTTGSLNCSRPLSDAEQNIRGNAAVAIAGGVLDGTTGAIKGGSYGIVATGHPSSGRYELQLSAFEGDQLDDDDTVVVFDGNYALFGPAQCFSHSDGLAPGFHLAMACFTIEGDNTDVDELGFTVYNTGRGAL